MGSKNQLDHHERLINVLGTELVNQREAREESDWQLTEMKGMLELLLRREKGKGKQSDPTPERSMAAGGEGASAKKRFTSGGRNPRPDGLRPPYASRAP